MANYFVEMLTSAVGMFRDQVPFWKERCVQFLIDTEESGLVHETCIQTTKIVGGSSCKILAFQW